MVKVSLDLGKKDFIWISILIVFLGVGLVFAYGGNSPEVMGHSSGEIMVNVSDGIIMSLQEAISSNSLVEIGNNDEILLYLEDISSTVNIIESTSGGECPSIETVSKEESQCYAQSGSLSFVTDDFNAYECKIQAQKDCLFVPGCDVLKYDSEQPRYGENYNICMWACKYTA